MLAASEPDDDDEDDDEDEEEGVKEVTLERSSSSAVLLASQYSSRCSCGEWTAVGASYLSMRSVCSERPPAPMRGRS